MTLENVHITFVGGGIMAEAIIRGLLRRQLAASQMIVVSDPVAERRAHLAENLHVRTMASNLEALAEAQIVVLAIKPQALGQVLAELKGNLPAEILLLSIIAGAKIETLRQGLGCANIVRILPNTPGQVGEGISVWTATPETPAPRREQAREIIAALGEEIFVTDEHYLDMATALSGSGPAYVFLFIEALTDAGVQMGLARPIAEKLALQTVKGSAIFAQQTGTHPAILRNMVTSPGGTTAAALYELEQGQLRATIARAVLAAFERAKYLGRLGNQ